MVYAVLEMVDPRTSWAGRGSDDRKDNAVMCESNSKRCPRCNVVKLFDDFYLDRKRRDGVSSWCADCSRTYARESFRRRKGLKIAQPRPCGYCGYSFIPIYKTAKWCSKKCNDAMRGSGTPEGSCRLYLVKCSRCDVVLRLSRSRVGSGS